MQRQLQVFEPGSAAARRAPAVYQSHRMITITDAMATGALTDCKVQVDNKQ